MLIASGGPASRRALQTIKLHSTIDDQAPALLFITKRRSILVASLLKLAPHPITAPCQVADEYMSWLEVHVKAGDRSVGFKRCVFLLVMCLQRSE